MSKVLLSRYQNRRKDLKILKRELGVMGFIQFMQDFGVNEGDYTQEREQWLVDKNVDDVIKNMKKQN